MKTGWIQTFTGKAMYPLDPKADDIDIRDIAHALYKLCRFTGHCQRFYSVGEHSIRVMKYLESIGESREIQRWGLLHDASEAYLCDLPRPLKRLPEFAFYRQAEAAVQKVICEKFALPIQQPEIVTQADMRMLAAEKNQIMGPEPVSWGDLASPAPWLLINKRFRGPNGISWRCSRGSRNHETSSDRPRHSRLRGGVLSWARSDRG